MSYELGLLAKKMIWKSSQPAAIKTLNFYDQLSGDYVNLTNAALFRGQH